MWCAIIDKGVTGKFTYTKQTQYDGMEILIELSFRIINVQYFCYCVSLYCEWFGCLYIVCLFHFYDGRWKNNVK